MEINKKLFDLEYNTQIRCEYEFLKDNGFEPSYIKKGRVKTYKYTKTPELFYAVAEFYKHKLDDKAGE